MQVKKIQALFKEYTTFLNTSSSERYLHLWETQSNFLAHWDLEARDLAEMLDRALQNNTTQRIWNRQAYEPRRMLLFFADLYPDFVIQMFSDLYNEDKEIESRIHRFTFYWDQLLEEYRNENPYTKTNKHYHDDGYEMTSYYLSFRYPKQYIPYQLERFQAFLTSVKSREIPKAHDTTRYFKLMRTIRKLMEKEEALLASHQKRMQKLAKFEEDSLLLVFDFLLFSTRNMAYYY